MSINQTNIAARSAAGCGCWLLLLLGIDRLPPRPNNPGPCCLLQPSCSPAMAPMQSATATLGALLLAVGTSSSLLVSPAPPPPPCTDKQFRAGQCMRLVTMTEKAKSEGAVCLDGSPGVFYWHPATDPKHKHDWLLSFKGDGWW
jgi:hypothetical protein